MPGKKVTVVCGTGKKFVVVNFGSFDETIRAIKTKWALSGDFTLQATAGKKGNKYDIVDDGDLMKYKDCDCLFVRQVTEGHSSGANVHQSPTQGQNIKPAAPSESRVPRHRVTPTKNIPVTFEGRRKSVTCDLASLKNIKDAARKKFQIECDINVKAISETDQHFDIDDEDDLDDLRTAKSLLIERKVEGVPGGRPQPEQMHDSSKQGQMALTGQDVYLDEAGAKSMIMYKKCNYTLQEQPLDDSPIVLEQEDSLKSNVNIPLVLENMELTAVCLRLASLGVQQNRGLHKIIQDMQFEVSKLSSLCDSTIVEFRIKAVDVLDDLECGFAYLFDGHLEFAEENFKSIGVTSKNMLQKTITLEAEVKAKEAYIKTILDKVTRDGMEPGLMYDESATSLLQGRIERGERESSESRKKCRQLDGDIEKSKDGIAKAAMSKKPVREDFMQWVSQGWVYKSELGGVVSDEEEMLKSMAKEERLKELREIRSAKEQELRANQDLMKMTKAMKEMVSKNADGMVDMSLRGAKQGVQSLLASLTPLLAFWGTLANECESIANNGIEGRLLNTCGKRTGEEKKLFWEGAGFKRQALKFYARWVALQKMCKSFHLGMETVQKCIQLSIREHPSPEEAKTRLADLLHDFDKKIVRQMQELQIKEKSAKAEEKAIEESGSDAV